MLRVKERARVAFLAGILLPLLFGRASADQNETLALDVVLNGYDTNTIVPVLLAGRHAAIACEDLKHIGVEVPRKAPTECVLASIAGLHWTIDQKTQAIVLSVAKSSIRAEHIDLGKHDDAGPSVQSSFGATLNYDVNTILDSGALSSASNVDLRLFSPYGTISSSALLFAGRQYVGGQQEIRLNTTYTWDGPHSLRRVQAGDYIEGGLSFDRDVRLTGLSVSSDFALQPNLITYPLPSFLGSVAVPSSATLLVNQAAVLSRTLAPGPFQFSGIPIVTGAGTVSLQTTNALGQQTTVTEPFYATPELLKPGLTEYAAQIGAVRLNWGAVSNDYGALAGAVTYRRGLASWLTLEMHGEATKGLVLGDGGAVFNLDNLAALEIDVGASSGHEHDGGVANVNLQREGRVFNFGADVLMTDQHFSDIAAVNGQPYPYRSIALNAGVSLGRYGSVGMGYNQIDAAPYTLSTLAGSPAYQPGPAQFSFLQPVTRQNTGI